MKKDPIFRPVSLEEMLLCREKRAEQQKEILRRFSSPVISFTMNVPGPTKISPLIERGFFFGMNEIRRKISEQNVLFSACQREATGCEALFAVDLPAETAKKICQTVEEETAVGRLFDLDVIGTNGEKLCRTEERCCIVCGKKGRACSASRAHGVPELWDKVQTVLSCHFRSADPRAIAKIAVQALKDEVLTTPKPGLVDQRNNGSHKDMSVPLFLSSAEALEDYFAAAVTLGMENKEKSAHETFLCLRKAGQAAEERMFAVTHGVNTHKGAVYSLGVLCGAIGRLWNAESPIAPMKSLLKTCGDLTKEALASDFSSPDTATAGKRLYHSLGLTGIRGEVAAGFPAVSECAFPILTHFLKEGKSLFEAGSVALIHLIATVEDTTLYHRGGKEGAAFAKKAARELLQAAPFPQKEALLALDDAFIQRNLSPGGCADLLAVSYFLHSLENFT